MEKIVYWDELSGRVTFGQDTCGDEPEQPYQSKICYMLTPSLVRGTSIPPYPGAPWSLIETHNSFSLMAPSETCNAPYLMVPSLVTETCNALYLVAPSQVTEICNADGHVSDVPNMGCDIISNHIM